MFTYSYRDCFSTELLVSIEVKWNIMCVYIFKIS